MPVIECDECGARYDATAEEALDVRGADGLVLCKECGALARLSDAHVDVSDGDPERPTDIDALSAETTLRPAPVTSPPEPPTLRPQAPTLPPEAPTLLPEAMERDTIADEEPGADHLDTLPDPELPASLPNEALTASPGELSSRSATDTDEQRDTLAEAPPDSSVPLESRDFIGVAQRPEPPPARARREALIADPLPPDIVVEPRAETTLPLRRSPLSDAPVVGDISAAQPPQRRSRAVPVVLTLAAIGAAFLAGLKLGDRAPRDDAASPVAASTATPPAASATEAALPSEMALPPPDAQALPPAPGAQALARPVEEQRVQPRSMIAASGPRVERGASAPLRKEATPITNELPPEPAKPGSFDATVAETALTQAAFLARNCKKPEDRSGMAIVTVTFSPSGRVTSANVSGRPFAGTETGSCIASSLRTARVPAFSGEFMTVKKTVLIQ